MKLDAATDAWRAERIAGVQKRLLEGRTVSGAEFVKYSGDFPACAFEPTWWMRWRIRPRILEIMLANGSATATPGLSTDTDRKAD